MSAPVDEIDVGHDSRVRPPWHDWTPRTRGLVTAAVVVLALVVGGVLLATRGGDPAPAAALSVTSTGAPGADVTVELGPATDRCPSGATCRYGSRLPAGAEAAFRDAFGSAGFIGRQTVVDAATGEVYLQLVRFSTGQLVTVTLTQEPLDRLTSPPVVDDQLTPAERDSGSVTVTAVRGGYLMTANAAGLPGQPLPIRDVQQWVQSVPVP